MKSINYFMFLIITATCSFTHTGNVTIINANEEKNNLQEALKETKNLNIYGSMVNIGYVKKYFSQLSEEYDKLLTIKNEGESTKNRAPNEALKIINKLQKDEFLREFIYSKCKEQNHTTGEDDCFETFLKNGIHKKNITKNFEQLHKINEESDAFIHILGLPSYQDGIKNFDTKTFSRYLKILALYYKDLYEKTMPEKSSCKIILFIPSVKYSLPPEISNLETPKNELVTANCDLIKKYLDFTDTSKVYGLINNKPEENKMICDQLSNNGAEIKKIPFYPAEKKSTPYLFGNALSRNNCLITKTIHAFFEKKHSNEKNLLKGNE